MSKLRQQQILKHRAEMLLPKDFVSKKLESWQISIRKRIFPTESKKQ